MSIAAEADEMPDDRVSLTQNRVSAVVRNMLDPESGAAIAPDDDLYDRGLTSLNMVNLMLAIEAEFEFVIPQRDLHPDNFRSLRAIDSLVARLAA